MDGSVGERLIEVKLDPSIESESIAWTLENKGPGTVWIIAKSDNLEKVVEIKAEGSADVETKVVDGYCYIVVDSDGKDETSLTIKAKAGETDAKTARGKNMNVLWF